MGLRCCTFGGIVQDDLLVSQPDFAFSGADGDIIHRHKGGASKNVNVQVLDNKCVQREAVIGTGQVEVCLTDDSKGG